MYALCNKPTYVVRSKDRYLTLLSFPQSKGLQELANLAGNTPSD